MSDTRQLPRCGQPFNPYKVFTGTVIPDAIMESTALTPVEKLCWGRLSRYYGKDGMIYPKQETLARVIGCSSRQVRRSLDRLEELRFIRRIKPEGKARSLHKVTRYELLWHKSFRPDKLSGRERTNCPVPTGQNVRSSGRESWKREREIRAREGNDTTTVAGMLKQWENSGLSLPDKITEHTKKLMKDPELQRRWPEVVEKAASVQYLAKRGLTFSVANWVKALDDGYAPFEDTEAKADLAKAKAKHGELLNLVRETCREYDEAEALPPGSTEAKEQRDRGSMEALSIGVLDMIVKNYRYQIREQQEALVGVGGA